MEVVLSASSSDNLIHVWNPNSGAIVKTLKGNTSEPGCFSLRKPYIDQMFGVQNNRQMLLSWSIDQEQPLHKSFSPEKLTSVTSTNDGLYCLAGSVSGIIYIWNIGSGSLLSSIHVHFKSVRCLEMSDSDELVVSGGDDGVINVFVFGKMFGSSTAETSATHPSLLHTLTDHSLPITGVSVGIGGVLSRMTSTSLDHTCKIWDLSTGECLLSILFPSQLGCVALDLGERFVWVGAMDGRIFSVCLTDHSSLDHFDDTESDARRLEEKMGRKVLEGHSGPVTSLDVSGDGAFLLSTSTDGKACVWDVSSGQLIRTFGSHKGPVSFGKFGVIPPVAWKTKISSNSNINRPTAPLQKYHYSLLTSSANAPSSEQMGSLVKDPFHTPILAIGGIPLNKRKREGKRGGRRSEESDGGEGGGAVKEKKKRDEKKEMLLSENEELKNTNEKLMVELEEWKKVCAGLYDVAQNVP